MHSFGSKIWSTGLTALILCFLFTCALSAQAQTPPTVTVTPGNLSFGVPTGTVPAVSAPDTVVVSVTGNGTTANFTGASVLGANMGDFIIDNNTCTGAINAPGSCQVSLHFKASLAPSTTLETATLHVSISGFDDLTVPLNGAYGAIKLFSALNVNNSLFSPVSWPGQPVKTVTVDLACPAAPTAILSSSPDGLNNVFQDNTIQVVNAHPGVELPVTVTTSNVCYGGDPNFGGFTGFPVGTSNCFVAAYGGAATSFLGLNPDLVGLPASFGVQPLNLMNPPLSGENAPPLYPPVLFSGPQSLTVQLIDAGGLLGAATLHLATNCTPTGVATGGTVTGNPIDPNVPGSLVQQFSFDTIQGQHINFSANLTALSGTEFPPAVPAVQLIGVPQTSFSSLVAGTSAAPSICSRYTGAIDPISGMPDCAGFLIQCTIVGAAAGSPGATPAGDNCPSSTMRNLLYASAFDSPDALPLFNILTAFPKGTGPGWLMGSDNWTAGAPNYSVGNCVLVGPEAGNVCPQNTLSAYQGASDPLPIGSTRGTNSLFFSVANMPLPTDIAAIVGLNSNGWVNNSNVAVNFTANPASYTATVPPANGFMAQPIYNETYGLSPASSPLPDTTSPVPGDVSIYNSNTTPMFAAPMCNANGGTTPGGSFTPPTTNLGTLAEGTYDLHHFATDCASTEGLNFTASTNPNVNWASFPFVAFGVDTTSPTLAASLSPGPYILNSTNSTVTFNCSDPAPADGGQQSGLQLCGTSPSGYLPTSGNPAVGPASVGPVSQALSTSSVGPKSVTVYAKDEAGNSASNSPPLPYNVTYEPAGTTCLGAPEHQILFPINPNGTSVFRKGPSVPARFRVCDAKGKSIGTPGVVKSVTVTPKSGLCKLTTDDDGDDFINDTGFFWNPLFQWWVRRISTQNLTSGVTYVYTVTLNDGTTISFQFGIK